MKYAFVGGTRVQVEPKLRGVCPPCESEVISKCGKRVIWHWANQSRSSCDPWWENEAAWHRGWKNRFPAEWQEVTHLGSAGDHCLQYDSRSSVLNSQSLAMGRVGFSASELIYQRKCGSALWYLKPECVSFAMWQDSCFLSHDSQGFFLKGWL